MSCLDPSLPMGICSFQRDSRASAWPGASLVRPAVFSIGPGATPFTLMLWEPHSRAKDRVRESTAALAAEAWD